MYTETGADRQNTLKAIVSTIHNKTKIIIRQKMATAIIITIRGMVIKTPKWLFLGLFSSLGNRKNERINRTENPTRQTI